VSPTRSRFVAGVLGAMPFLLLGGPSAADAPMVDTRTLVEVRTLDGLPREVNELLGRGKPGTAGIANVYEPFNQTDVVNEKLPSRRFLVAGSNLSYALIAYEQGGRAHSFFAKGFSLDASGWKQVGSWTLPRAAASLHGLIEEIDHQVADATPAHDQSLSAIFARQARRYGTRPVRREGPLRAENISDEEVREIESIGLGLMPGALVNISGVVTGCPCEEGASCSDQVWIVVYRPGESKGVQLSKIGGRWGIGPLQQWWFDYETLSARRPWDSMDSILAFEVELNKLYDRFPICATEPASKKAPSTQTGH